MALYINYIKLYKYFIDKEGLTPPESWRNIWRTRNLPKEFKEVVYKITEGRQSEVGDFNVKGITIAQLCNDEKMKHIQAVFFLDWLRREPANALAFMASRRFREPAEIDEDFKAKIKAQLEHVQAERHIEIDSSFVPEDKSEKDIDVETESEYAGCMTADSMKAGNSEENQEI